MSCITEATLDDIPQLCEMLTILFTQEKDFQPDTAKQTAGLRQIIGHPELGRILVFREGTAVAGMVSLLFTISTACGGPVALLEDMIVHPDRRCEGVGSALLKGALALAQAQGCSRVTLLTDRTNGVAQEFYTRHGFILSEMVPMRFLFDKRKGAAQ
ncbi:MAG: GNAT family N-acetyltransferase [Candidatus Methylomirabilota bacterium]